MVIIDFDDTLMDTQRFIAAREDALGQLGVPVSLVRETYIAARFCAGAACYSDKRHAACLAERGYDSGEVAQVLSRLTKTCREYLFPDTLDFLSYIKDEHRPLLLLSLGAADFQEEKVRYSGIYNYFDEVYTVDETKTQAMERLWSRRSPGPVWFINDKIEETAAISDRWPQIRAVLKVSPKYPREAYEKSGRPHFFRLAEIQDFMARYGQLQSA
ncbi:MAG: hypothetical protein UY92_C0005G0041 [Candidatus Magasanikbacteria bacterium GW2011_GWA2_56_11]|uniref:Uncharacterized protein n=1 Tax=Candidatus Magasanikbacteria bacterium GW2011_GWA2_56_11 TaxID=1619044 RepID=A0A0G2BAU6_9BACT|nr:MAG: hypothetical protein UY92_C0005G0041 [Candidatus Magasanikbacteria bacterium GW2011_GWA2_56_11]